MPGFLRMFFFCFILTVFSIIMGSAVILWYPFTLLYDKRRDSLQNIGVAWARLIRATMRPWWTFHFQGREHLAKPGQAVVYVSNHQSQSDIIALFLLNSQFRWLAKSSLFKIPFMGWGLCLTGNVSVKRGDKKSAEQCLIECAQHLKNGTPMLFFPEGTRSKDGHMKTFKSGAFRLAKDCNVPIVPISLSGCARLLPKGSLTPQKADVYVTIHPPLMPKNFENIEQFMEKTKQCIASALPDSEK